MKCKQQFISAVAVIGVLLIASPTLALDYDNVCKDVSKDTQGTELAGDTAKQKKEYCDAADAALQGSENEKILMGIWGAVAGVCTLACVTSMFAASSFTGSEWICIGAGVGATVTDAVLTKNFMGAIMGLSGTAMSAGMSLMADAPKAGEAKKDWGSCMAAAMAGIQVFMKHTGAKTQEDSADRNLESAAQLAGYQPSMDPLAGDGGDQNITGQKQSAQVSGSRSAEGGSSVAARSECGKARAAGNYAGIINCATSADSNLPAFVKDPKFPKEFKKQTGQNLTDYVKRNDSPEQMLASSMGAGLNSGQQAKLATAIGDLKKQMLGEGVEGSAYASGGGGGGGTGGGGDDMDMAAMMQGMMEQLMPKQPGEEKLNTGVSAVIFANKNRSPAAVAEDKTLSIFDRVTYRYYFVSKKMMDGS